MEAEEESVKDQNWLPRSIPALSKEEFYPEDSISNTDMIHLSGVLSLQSSESQVSLHTSKPPLVLPLSSLRHLLEISVPSFLANTEQISYAADTSVHSVHHFYLKSGT